MLSVIYFLLPITGRVLQKQMLRCSSECELFIRDQPLWRGRQGEKGNCDSGPATITNVGLPRRAWLQERHLSVAEVDSEEADSWRPSADHTPCSWAISPSLKKDLSSTSPCLFHHLWLCILSYVPHPFWSISKIRAKIFTQSFRLMFHQLGNFILLICIFESRIHTQHGPQCRA